MVKPKKSSENAAAGSNICWAPAKCITGAPTSPSSVPAPRGRSGHTLTCIGPNAYMFGGLEEGREPPGPTDEMLLLKLTSAEFQWHRVKVANGACPCARWRHTATHIGDSRILIFGGFKSSSERLNDVWVYSAISRAWEYYGGGASTDLASQSLLAANAPPPRGSHSSVLIRGKLWVFGGYGGISYSRKELNDVSTLDCDTYTWSRVNPKGQAPEVRSCHTAVAVDDLMFVIGGRNATHEFSDMWVLDTELAPPVWSRIDSGDLHVPRWNHAAYAVMSVPDWKIFVFGGVVGQLGEEKRRGVYVNDLAIFDTGTLRWVALDPSGAPPRPRGDMPLEYHTSTGRLVLHGGAADGWFADTFTLDVATVVGPPYAIAAVTPPMGPITGGTLLEISGVDFIKTSDVVVRFALGKHWRIEVQGSFVNQSLITCLSPDFTIPVDGQEGAWPRKDPVEVRVSLGGQSFTTTRALFTFFPVTEALRCFAYGPGLLCNGLVEKETCFIIQAMDGSNIPRTSGGDEFQVNILYRSSAGGSETKESDWSEDDDEDNDSEVDGVAHGADTSPTMKIRSHLQDLGDGTYRVRYLPLAAGTYEIAVRFLGTFGGKPGVVRGFPCVSSFVRDVDPENNSLSGPLMLQAAKDYASSLLTWASEVKEKLRVANPGASGKWDFDVLVAAKKATQTFSDELDGMILVSDRCQAMLDEMDRAMVSVPAACTQQLARARAIITDLVGQMPEVDARLAPAIKAAAPRVKQAISSMERDLDAFVGALKMAKFTIWETGLEGAHESLSDARTIALEKEKSLQSVDAMAQLFGLSSELAASRLLLAEMNDDIVAYLGLWQSAQSFSEVVSFCGSLRWIDVNPEGLEESAKTALSNILRLPAKVRPSGAFDGLLSKVRSFSGECALASSLFRAQLAPRHWTRLQAATNATALLGGADMVLQELFRLDLAAHVQDVELIVDRAGAESKHAEALALMNERWSTMQWDIHATAVEGGLNLSAESRSVLEADIIALQVMLSSQFAHWKSQCLEWQTSLTRLDSICSTLDTVQQLLDRLSPLFLESKEVQRELPHDQERFAGVSEGFRSTEAELRGAKSVLKACGSKRLLVRLEGYAMVLETCKMHLGELLQRKREAFPRFYLVSDGILMDILANGHDPRSIARHISKIFLATKSIKLVEDDESHLKASAFIASIGEETVPLSEQCELGGKNVEIYLLDFMRSQQDTLAALYSASRARYPNQSRVDWLLSPSVDRDGFADPAQIALLTASTSYVEEVESAMLRASAGDSASFTDLLDLQKSQLDGLITRVRMVATAAERMRLVNLIMLDGHFKDLLQTIIKESVTDPDDFLWSSQLKHRARVDSGGARVEIAQAEFDYAFEYLGSGSGLVITPLTMRAYVTAAQALHMQSGCGMIGSTGAGKMETIKSLAREMGKNCYIFNCSLEMDSACLGAVYKGLAASGAWGCMAAMDRINSSVLSISSLYVKEVSRGLRTGGNQVMIDGTEVALQTGVGLFITLSPAYTGRISIPDSLKDLFRPVAFANPDLALVCAGILTAEGFLEAKQLSRKICALFAALPMILFASKAANGYNWGMRAIKHLVEVASILRREDPDISEETILLRAVRRILRVQAQHDEILKGLVNEYFPGADETASEQNVEMHVIAQYACEDFGLWPDPDLLSKAAELHELLNERHCTFVVGATGIGKTTVWKLALEMRNRLCKSTDEKAAFVSLNPKTLTCAELYGHFNDTSPREWKDGILSKILRTCEESAGNPQWMVFDADPDPSWIESMNTAMDDNQTLTLASHERIFLQSSSRIIVEAQDMKHATPATVSRAGIIYMQYSDSQWRSLVASWVVSHSSVSDAQRHELHRLFEAYVPPILGFMELRRASLYSWSPLAGVSSLLRSLDAFGSDAAVEEVFSFCCIWSFGSILGVSLDGVDYRPIFSDWWRVELSSIVRLPLDGSIFDYVLGRDGIEFEPWMDHPDFSQRVSFDSDSSSPFEVIVPTADLAPASFWANKHVSLGHSVMIGGETGVGKTQLALSILRKTAVVGFPEEQAASRSKTLVRMVNLHPVSDANSIRNVLNEPESSNLLLFVDDFNLPVPDDYGCRGAHEAIRQQLNFGYWHEPRSLEQHTLTGCQYIVAFDSSPRTAPLNSRLQRHFLPVWMCRPSPSSLLTILDTFLAGHFSTSSGFSKTFSGVLKDVMKGVLDVHQACLDKFSMSPTNIHCAFNMRHMLGVVDGLLRAAPEDFSTPDGLVHLWMHESERVYADGLSSPADFDFFCDTMAAQTKRSFPQFGLSRFYAGDPPNKLIFHTSSEGRYIAVENSDELQPDIELHLAQLNHNPGPMGCLDVTLFPDACLSIIRIARILRQSAGHVMTIGLAGSGKRTLCRLAAAIADVPLTSCSAHDLGVDLARAHKAAGLSGLGRAFLLHHSQISDGDDRALSLVSDLLSGTCDRIYPAAERASVIDAMAKQARKEGLVTPLDDAAAVWELFVRRARLNFHIVLCFSPADCRFHKLLSRYPSLASCTFKHWVRPWSTVALETVGRHLLRSATAQDVPDEQEGDGDDDCQEQLFEEIQIVTDVLVRAFEAMGKTCQSYAEATCTHVHRTPGHYVKLVKTYTALYRKRRAELCSALHRLRRGVHALQQSVKATHSLEATISEMLTVMESIRVNAESMGDRVRSESEAVAAQAAVHNVEAAKVASMSADVEDRKEKLEQQMAAVEPNVIAATSALDMIDKKDLGEFKSMNIPPPGVADVFAALMVLLANISPGVPVSGQTGLVKDKDKTWDSAKKSLLGNINGLLEDLRNFKGCLDSGTVPPINLSEVRMYFDLQTFSSEFLAKRSRAASAICDWMKNIVQYGDVVAEVEPGRLLLVEAEAQLQIHQEHLAEVHLRLSLLQEKLAIVTSEYETMDERYRAAKESYERSRVKLDLAQRLVSSLGEEERWTNEMPPLQRLIEAAVPDTLMAACFLTLCGPFSQKFRNTQIKSWSALMQEEGMSLKFQDPLKVLASPEKVAAWTIQGLPEDRFSKENAAIISNVESSQALFLFDPHDRCISWLKSTLASDEKGAEPIIVAQGASSMRSTLKSAMGEGRTLILQRTNRNVLPIIYPVLARATISRGGRTTCRLGEEDVDIHPNFRIILHSLLGTESYPPELQTTVTVVNCAVTKQGLEAQLLALVMERDCPHVAKRRADLVLQRSHLCIRIGSLEDEILQHLSTCEGDVSADRALIDRLENLKKLSSEAKIQLHDTGSAIIRTQNVCDMYMNVARRGSLLFFLVFDLCELDPHYVCGIGTFIAVFMRGMEPVGESLIPEDEEELERDLPRRVAELKNRVTSSIYSFLERGMTESDKVTVAATLGLRIWESSRLPQGLLRDRQALLTAILGHEESAQNSADEVPGVWGEVMDARRWRALHRLESLSHSFPAFSKIQEKALGDTEAWSAWLQDPLPEIAELPTHLSDLDDVGRLLLVRAMYPERFRASLEHFVRSTLGDSYISHSPTSLASAWVETTSSMPTLLLSCPGSQPTARIEELGAGFGLSGSESTFVQISMGPGEKRRAEVVLRELSASGGWMVLQNVHLVTDWLHSFNEIFEDLSPTFHENFRCFLIAEAQPAVHLPEGLLQKCMKIRLEPPSGLAANLRRSWSFFDQSKLEACSKELQYRACLYGLCCFHAILLGRKRFGSTGWSTPYRFSDGDLLMCANLLQERIECAKKGSVPWRELRYIFGEVVYGGYVRSDIWDQRLALAYLELIFDDEANLLHGKMLAPGLSAPSPEGMDYELYWEHMERNIPQDSPAMFGLPVNAEMGCLVTEGTSMARALSLIYTDKPTSGNKDVELLTVDKYTSTLTSFASEADICGILLPRIPPTFNIQELEAVAERLRYQEHGPYAMCAFQECARMNVLLLGMRKGIEELLKVMRGQILASNSTDTLLESLTAGEVPTVWQNAAWPSSMKLSGWLDSLTQRVSTLRAAWTRRGLRLPYSVWLSGLFNPSAFLLAVKQVHAHRFSIPLECLTISMDVSCLYSADEAETLQLYPEDGAIVHGLFIEGARWKPLQELNDSSARLKKLAETLKVEPQPSLESCAVQPGCLAPSLPQALRSPLPLVFIRATTIQEEWEVLPGPVGCLRWEPDIYDCPVYSTSARGGELVFVAGLPMSEGELVRKWVLAGAAIVLEDL